MPFAGGKDLGKMKIESWTCLYKGKDLGYSKDLDLSGIDFITKEMQVGNFGPIVLDRVHLGMSGTAKLTLHQVDPATLRYCMPWISGDTGVASLTPTSRYFSEYANAGVVKFLPDGATGDDEAVIFSHAFPILKFPKRNSTGADYSEIALEFRPYPNRTLLPTTVSYGSIFGTPV